MQNDQNLKNHARIVPMYHVGTFFPLLANFIWSIAQLWRNPSGDHVVALLLAIGLLLMFVSVRVQILTVQDRVIRLEMQLRLARVLPAALQTGVGRLTAKQLVALRFASDAELPSLVEQVLSGSLPTQKAIKSQVRDWQADHLRA